MPKERSREARQEGSEATREGCKHFMSKAERKKARKASTWVSMGNTPVIISDAADEFCSGKKKRKPAEEVSQPMAAGGKPPAKQAKPARPAKSEYADVASAQQRELDAVDLAAFAAASAGDCEGRASNAEPASLHTEQKRGVVVILKQPAHVRTAEVRRAV